jgi:hypothetical protein
MNSVRRPSGAGEPDKRASSGDKSTSGKHDISPFPIDAGKILNAIFHIDASF